MNNYTENIGFCSDFARNCMTCSVYLALTVRTTKGGGTSVSYFGANSFHPTLERALSSVESTRTRGSRFELREIPALFFQSDTRGMSLHRARGLVVAEVNTLKPFASCGALSLSESSMASVGDQFVLQGENFSVMEAPAEVAGLKRDLLAWRSISMGPGYKLGWRELAPKQWDLSHLRSLRMRLDQQVRNMQSAPYSTRASGG